MPSFNATFAAKIPNLQLNESSHNDIRSTEELSLDNLSPRNESEFSLDMEVEKSFSVSVQKKRKRLVDLLATKRQYEVIISPHKKAFKG